MRFDKIQHGSIDLRPLRRKSTHGLVRSAQRVDRLRLVPPFFWGIAVEISLTSVDWYDQ